jgi:hypothetical protein
MSLKCYTLLFFWSCFSLTLSTAQTSWRKSVKAAEAAVRQSNYADAARYYEAAWTDKPKKKNYIYKAAEYYALVRDYAKAAEAYKNLRGDAEFPLAQLQYARMLKQSGAYDKAGPEYADFVSSYNGKDADVIRDLVQNEIRGCDFALQSIRMSSKNPLQVNRMSPSINSIEAEFAPVAFADDLLYFSSNIAGNASIYRSQKQGGVWTKAVVPNGFPELKNKDFCNGAFSPDNKRFYYTECTATEGLNAQCALYVMVRRGSNWSESFRLPDDINAKGFTATHPYISEVGEDEVLYFASNKTGTKGGMDIWKTTRSITTDELKFSAAVNLGDEINTKGDEITPFFDASEGVLYFASNGHLSMGGLDIMKSKYATQNNTWGKIENVGAPINSSADDYYYVKNKSKTGGFLVSNKATKERQHTLNEDIFEFALPPKNLTIKGQVLERATSVVMKDARLNLYEILANGQKRLLNTKVSNDGTYEFVLVPDKKIRVEAEKKGFTTASHEFVAVKDSIAFGFEKNIYLDVEAKANAVTLSDYIEETKVKIPTKTGTTKATPTKVPTTPNKIPTTTVVTTTTGKKQDVPAVKSNTNVTTTKENATASVEKRTDILTEKGSTSVGTMPLYETISKTNERLITSAPKLDGIYYKIQMIAVKRFDREENRYRPVKDLGRIDTEYIVSKDMVRVLLADFAQYDSAQEVLAEVKKNREFAGAYIIKYENGIRAGAGK